MDPALKALTKKIPPPTNPRFSEVNWGKLENSIGLTYPPSFKEFVGVYGGSVWFDNLSPLYAEAKTDVDVEGLLKSVKTRLKWLDSNMYDEHFQKVELPLYPAEGGLFPFMIDYGGGLGCWRTEQKDPKNWPVLYWQRGPIIILGKMTIAKMILDFLKVKPHMVNVWGDVRLYEPERIRLTETTEPTKKVEKVKKKKEKN